MSTPARVSQQGSNIRLQNIRLALQNTRSLPLPSKSVESLNVSSIPPRNEFVTTLAHTNAFNAVMSGQSVVIHGGPGTGKTRLLQSMIEELTTKYQDTPGSLVVTATNDVAAFNLGGVVLEEFIGWFPPDSRPMLVVAATKEFPEMRDRWDKIETLIVDDVHMLDGRILDIIDRVAMSFKGNGSDPFGGVQVVMAGDFFQASTETFCFEARAWLADIYSLEQGSRQIEPEFITILQRMRFGKIDPQSRSKLNSLSRPVVYPDGISGIEIFAESAEASALNSKRFLALSTSIVAYSAVDEFTSPSVLAAMVPQEKLFLRVGAQVMVIRCIEPYLPDGTIGKVIGFSPDVFRLPVVQCIGPKGTIIERLIEPFKWTIKNGADIVATRIQIPLVLGWATSIGRCRGMTFDRIAVDFSQFKPGFEYAVLSRSTSINCLQIRGMSQTIRVNPKVLAWHESLSKPSN